MLRPSSTQQQQQPAAVMLTLCPANEATKHILATLLQCRSCTVSKVCLLTTYMYLDYLASMYEDVNNVYAPASCHVNATCGEKTAIMLLLLHKASCTAAHATQC